MHFRNIFLSLCVLFTSTAATVSAMDANAVGNKLKIDMLSTVLSAPYILLQDSENPDYIRIALATDALANMIKLANLFNVARQEGKSKSFLYGSIERRRAPTNLSFSLTRHAL